VKNSDIDNPLGRRGPMVHEANTAWCIVRDRWQFSAITLANGLLFQNGL
jgi:hypothetical protein